MLVKIMARALFFAILGGAIVLFVSPFFGWNSTTVLIIVATINALTFIVAVMVAWLADHRTNEYDDYSDEEYVEKITEERATDNILINHIDS